MALLPRAGSLGWGWLKKLRSQGGEALFTRKSKANCTLAVAAEVGGGDGSRQVTQLPIPFPQPPPPGEEKGCISPTSLGRPVASLEPLNRQAEEELSNLSPTPSLHSWGN